jgi:hypothetical protein
MFRLFRRSERESRPVESRHLTFAPDVSAHARPDGVVFLHSGKGVLYSSNAVGARIWELLRKGRSVDQIATELAAEFPVPAETIGKDTRQFVGELASAGIVCWARR